VPAEDTERAVGVALEAGYRHIDTAEAYRNEKGVGRALAASGLPREELFITTKLWNSHQGRDPARRALANSLGRLGLDRVDLYLIHWPLPSRDLYVETWRAFEELKAEGGTTSIGVSNFQRSHLQRLLTETGTTPAVNQVELHPYFQQRELCAYHAEHGIATEDWSPLGQGGEVLEDPAIVAIAEAHGRTPAQVIIRWHLQLGNIVIPKSVTPERIRSNIEVFDFELSANELSAIDELDRGRRLGPDPDQFALA
jgi:2,5-diketo-D-gluconate reductase A